VICEYLEDAFPEPPLRPADPVARATMRTLSRICDFYLVMAMVPLFAFSAQRRSTWEPARLHAATDKMAEALGFIEHHIGTEGYAVGRGLTQADGALLPQLQLAYEWAPALFGTPNPLGRHPKLAAYWEAIANDPIAARLLKETRDAVAEEARRARAAVAKPA
jgi:glutathione S-transferase